MKVDFISLGNVGDKLAGSLSRNNFDLTVRDLNKDLTQSFFDLGAEVTNSAPKAHNNNLISIIFLIFH